MEFILTFFGVAGSALQLLWSVVYSFVMHHIFEWLKVIFVFFVIDSIFRALVLTGWLNPLATFIIFLETKGVFPLVPESGITWVVGMFTFWLSVECLWLIFGNTFVDSSDFVSRDQKEDNVRIVNRKEEKRSPFLL